LVSTGLQVYETKASSSILICEKCHRKNNAVYQR
jgi:hypothetical protein